VFELTHRVALAHTPNPSQPILRLMVSRN